MSDLDDPIIGFDWDRGNTEKCQQHGLNLTDVEYVLAHAETLIVPDERHSRDEPRFIAIGRSSSGRYSFVAFTTRESGPGVKLRPVSARFMHKKEIAKYEKEISSLED